MMREGDGHMDCIDQSPQDSAGSAASTLGAIARTDGDKPRGFPLNAIHD